MVAGIMVSITVVPVTLVRAVQASNNLGLPVRPPTRPPACLPVPVCLFTVLMSPIVGEYSRPQKEDDLKYEYKLKNEDDLKDEDDLNNKDDLKNEEDIKN